MESPIHTINSVLAEPSNGFDDLRIIAGEMRGRDRAMLESIADELETAQRTVVLVHMELVETRQKLIAANEVILALKRAALPGVLMSLSGDMQHVSPVP